MNIRVTKKPKSNYRKMSKETRNRVILIVVGAIAAAVLMFWGLFYITKVEVTGNSRYSEDEVKSMAMGGFFDHNSLLLTAFRSHIDLSDVPFMDYVDVEYLGRNSVRLHVTEKTPVGYVRVDETDYYFDAEGLVLEAIPSYQTDSANAEAAAVTDEASDVSAEADGTTDALTEAEATAVTPAAEETTTDGTTVDGTAAETATPTPELYVADASGNDFQPALTDVPMIVGLKFSSIAVDEVIPVKDPSVFYTITSITRMIDKYDIKPDYVEFLDDGTIMLHYGTVRVNLGTDDSLLEQKMTKVAGILPKLTGLSGVLHLENYTEDTINIIFDQDIANTTTAETADASAAETAPAEDTSAAPEEVPAEDAAAAETQEVPADAAEENIADVPSEDVAGATEDAAAEQQVEEIDASGG